MPNDVFISYRRNGGDIFAHLLYEQLTSSGYSVFQDTRTLRSGKFDVAIYRQIEQCSDFILILSPNALDRCSDESDWVRREILHAIEYNKHIIPIVLRGFNWPEQFPDELQELKRYNRIAYNPEYNKQFTQKLKSFLHKNDYQNNVSIQGTIKNQYRPIRFILVASVVMLILLSPLIYIYSFNMSFGLVERILYFSFLVVFVKFILNEIETRPNIASLCYGTLTEEDLNLSADVVYSRISSAFGKEIFLSTGSNDIFQTYYVLRRLAFGSWDNHKINYLRASFKNSLEWFDPSVFYLHESSKGSQPIQMLTRQGFILKSSPVPIPLGVDYLVKDNFHVFLLYNKNKLDQAVIYQCPDDVFLQKFEKLGIGNDGFKINSPKIKR